MNIQMIIENVLEDIEKSTVSGIDAVIPNLLNTTTTKMKLVSYV